MDQSRSRFIPERFEIQLDVRFLPGLESEVIRLVAVGDVDDLIGEVVDDCLEISGGELPSYRPDGDLRVNLSVVLVDEVCEFDIPVFAVPVHAEIDSVLDFGVPGGIGNQVLIIDDVRDSVGDLEAAEGGELRLAVSDSENEVACLAGGLEAVDSLVESLVELDGVPHHEGEGVADSGLLAEGGVRIADSDLRDGHFMFVDSGEHSEPAGEADIGEGVTDGWVTWMIDDDGGKFSEGAIEIPVESSELDSLLIFRGVPPETEHAAVALGDLSDHMDSARR